jgi:predicted metal-dependent hydrolase
MGGNKSLQFGNTIIEYDVSFVRRKTVAIEVYPDQQVTVIAPEGCEPVEIEALVRKRAGWIQRQQQQFSEYVPHEIPRAYVSGESYRYPGRQYRLKVLEGEPDAVKQERGFIYVTVSDKGNTRQV